MNFDLFNTHYRKNEDNTYAVIENNVPSWLCGLKKHTGTYKYKFILYIYKYKYSSRRSKMVLIIIAWLWPKWLCGNQALGHMMYVMMWCTVSFLIAYKNLLAKFSHVYAGVILETEGSIQQSSSVNNSCFIDIDKLDNTKRASGRG